MNCKMRQILLAAMVSLATVASAQADPKSDVATAIMNLASSSNYSWSRSIPRAGEIEQGKTRRDGLVYLRQGSNRFTYEEYFQGNKFVENFGHGWKGLTGPIAQFRLAQLKEYNTPAAQAQELADQTTSFQKTNEGYTGTLSEQIATHYLNLDRGKGIQVSGASGSVTFAITNGVLSRLDYHVLAIAGAHGVVRNVDRIMKIQIKDVGTTQIELPADVQKLWAQTATTEPAPAH